MAELINNPRENSMGGTGLLIGGIVFVVFALLFIFYGISAMRGSALTSAPQAPVQQVPQAEGDSGDSIAIPDEIDVNVNQPNE